MDDLDALLHQLGLDRSSLDLDDMSAITTAVFTANRPRSARQLASDAGLDLEGLVSTYALLGVEIDDPDRPLFRDDEAEFLASLRGGGVGAVTGGWSDDLLRVIGTALARIADAGVAGYVGEVEQGLAEAGAHPAEWVEMALAGLHAVEDLSRGMPALLVHHFRQAVDRQRLAQETVTSRLHHRYAVGFVDLVGFTSLSRTLDARALVEVIRRFENRAHDIAAAHGGRIVKHIGDEVMFAALEPGAACAIALDLLGDADAEEGAGWVDGRAGIAWGEVVSRGGDYYGSVVNLAARLVDAAVQGEILVDEAVAGAVGEATPLEPAGRRQLKGFDEPVRVWSLG